MAKKQVFLLSLIFIIAFSVTLFFTLGIPFFWEDCENVVCRQQPGRLSLFYEQLKENMFHVINIYRPMSPIVLGLQGTLCGPRVEAHRFFRAFLYTLLILTCFLFLKRFTSSDTVASMGAIFLLFCPENWLQVVYQDAGLYSHLFLAMAFLIFLQVYRLEGKLAFKLIMSLLIIFLIFLSIGAKHEGRYAVFVMLVFCLIYNRKSIINNWWFYSVLLFISLPFVGLFRLVCNHQYQLFLMGSPNRDCSLTLFFKNFRQPLFTLGIFLWGVLFLALVIHLIIAIKKKNLFFWLRDSFGEGLVFSFCWFICALIFNYFIQGWPNLGPRHFSQVYYMYLWMPFLIFIFTISYSVYWYLKRSKIFLFLIALMLLISFLVNLKNLNQFRVGWGGYWISLGNLKKFIEERDDNALLLSAPKHFYPRHFFCRTPPTHNKMELTPLYNNVNYIKERYLSGKFKNIYVAFFVFVGERINFDNPQQMEFVGVVDNSSDYFYNKLKRFLPKKATKMISIYRYKP